MLEHDYPLEFRLRNSYLYGFIGAWTMCCFFPRLETDVDWFYVALIFGPLLLVVGAYWHFVTVVRVEWDCVEHCHIPFISRRTISVDEVESFEYRRRWGLSHQYVLHSKDGKSIRIPHRSIRRCDHVVLMDALKKFAQRGGGERPGDSG